MGKTRTGHNGKHWKSTKKQRAEFGHAHAPAIVNPPSNRCQVCGEENVLLSMLDSTRPRVCIPCIDAYMQWNEIKAIVKSFDAGYDPTCGMQPLEEWRRDFLHLMFQQCRYERGVSGFRWAAEAYYLSIHTKSAPVAAQPAPVPRSDAKLYIPRKEPDMAEKACRRLSDSKGHWDAMYQAQQHWHEARRMAEARQNARKGIAA